MQTEWKLHAILEQHNITVCKPSSIPKSTRYNLVNKRPARIDLGTLSAVLGALDSLTGSKVKVNDVLERGDLEYVGWEQNKAGQDVKRIAALRPVGLDQQEVSEEFLVESLRPLDEELKAFYRPELLDD